MDARGERSAQPGQVNVKVDQQVVSHITQYGDPFVMQRDLIEFIAMYQQISASIRCGVYIFMHHHHVAERDEDRLP